MHSELAPWIVGTDKGKEAKSILDSCVHCGFCLATCPTYQLLGDELDSPRGRIMLIKQVLEGEKVTAKTQLHLDRCLTCLNCETTCPSGVEYGRLLDIGRDIVEQSAGARPLFAQFLRASLRRVLPSPWFGLGYKVGQKLKPLLPQFLKSKLPDLKAEGQWPTSSHARKMILLEGCVQPAMAPNINAATARVFDAVGVQMICAKGAGCCGALRFHLNDQAAGLDDARRNIDHWWPHLEAGAQAIVANASGCGVFIKQYGHLLRADPAYADRAAKVSALTFDASESLHALAEPLRLKRRKTASKRIVFQSSCTLQHGQKLDGRVEALLQSLGANLISYNESNLCCGSAGTYSLLQPKIAYSLRDRKLSNLQAALPELILSANIGCITHLASAAQVPVLHWIEWIDAGLSH